MGKKQNPFISVFQWFFSSLAWDILGKPLISIFASVAIGQFGDVPMLTDIYPWYLAYPIYAVFVYGFLQIITDIVNVIKSDQINAKIGIEVFPRHLGGYASIKVHNREEEDLIEPALIYRDIFFIEGEKRISKLDEINPNNAVISWGAGSSDKNVISGKNHAVFNLAKVEEYVPTFLFGDGSSAIAQSGVYEIILAIDGRMGKDNKKIKRITKTCYIEFHKDILERDADGFSDGEYVKEVQQAFYIDIRDTTNSTKEIQPSILRNLDMSSLIRRELNKKKKGDDKSSP